MMDDVKEMTVQVITPNGVIYDHHGTYVNARTVDGEMGILPNMIETIGALEVEEVRVRRPEDKQGKIDYIAVSGGFIEVNNNLVTIVSDSAERDRDIDVPRAQRAKIRAEKQIQEAEVSHQADERMRAEVALHRAINRINVSQHQGL